MVDQTETPLAILFADICGSTKLYDSLGDAKARDTVARGIAVMTDATTRNRGRLIKTIGDEVMSTFKTAEDATQAAAEMQDDMKAVLVDGLPIFIRVGYHFGPALIEGADVFGDAVNVAARMAGQAKAAQILTTAGTIKHLSPDWQASTRRIDHTVLRGKRDDVEIVEILWEREDVTRMATYVRNITGPTVRRQRLVLQFQGKQFEISEQQPALTMGRGDQADIIVRHGLVSRLHARIEFRKGNFILTDQSINGTYVRDENAAENFIRRDSIALQGDGLIGFGQAPLPGMPEAIRYTCVE